MKIPLRFAKYVARFVIGVGSLARISLALVPGFVCRAAESPATGTVYLVVGSDTAIWNAAGTVDAYTRYPYYPQSSFTDSNTPIYQVMDPNWREQFKDSYGQTIKFTWWMMSGNIYRDATNLNVPLANTMTLHLMKQYHGDAIRRFGDEVSLHYHTYRWSDYNGTGVFYWNQTRTFRELKDDFDITLAQYLLEEGVFPISFRSGWHFMDQDWQEYLYRLIPYCFHNNYPARVPWFTNVFGPIAGVEDWSRAPAAFVPFRPSTNDYQVPGDGPGWNVRSSKIQGLTQTNVDQMFSEASNEVDQVACLWTHLPENFVASIVRLGSLIATSRTNYPTVPFRYCTAVEAMQRWRGLTNEPTPQLTVVGKPGPTVSLVITSTVPIFQARPFVCVRDAFQQYRNLTDACEATSTNSWLVDLGVSSNFVQKVAIAVTDRAGNLATQTLRFLPDDLFLDNLDSQYSEELGSWASSTNFAWGIDARTALLESNTIAQAGWNLPLHWSGRYRISIQVPSLPNPATNVSVTVLADGTNICSVTFPEGLQTNQWAFVASVALDQSLSNRVKITASGMTQPGTQLAADVLRIVPVSEATVPPISEQHLIMFAPALNGYLLDFYGRAKLQYNIQRSPNAVSGWTTLQIISPEGTGVLEFIDLKPLSSQAFYRIVEQ